MQSSNLVFEGVQLMFVGMSMVFVFLSVLVFVTSFIRKFLQDDEDSSIDSSGAEVSSDEVAAISAAIHKFKAKK